VYAYVCDVCVCVCVSRAQKERERERDTGAADLNIEHARNITRFNLIVTMK